MKNHPASHRFSAIFSAPGNGLRERAYAYALNLTRNHEEALELTQEAFYRALKSEHQYDGKRSPTPWLLRILRNAYFDRRRNARIRRTCSLEDLQGDREGSYEPEGRDREPVDELLVLETASSVRETLGALRPAHREALRLRHLKGLSYAEIAETTRTPVGTVRSRLSRAMEAFRRAYPTQGDLAKNQCALLHVRVVRLVANFSASSFVVRRVKSDGISACII